MRSLVQWSSFVDVNRIYLQHQISLMRASMAGNGQAHAKHLADADGFARRISAFQSSKGAGAASMWNQNCFSKNPAFGRG